jgi:class 3 adenylate cyclase
MRPSTQKALLVIADISGFTQFMKSHENHANHAMQVVVELLRAVISAAAPPLKLAEVEGDAAFFYAICKEDGDSARELAAIKKQVMSFFRSFYQTLHRLRAFNPCARTAQDLRLKVVIHAGEVAIEHIHGFDKLFGMDVILAHRLLKNSVPSPEYVLMTEAAYNWLGDFHQLESERQTEYCENIGVVETVVIYLPAQFIHVGKKVVEKFHSNAGHFLPVADLFNTARGRFETSLNDYLLPEPFHQSARAQPLEAELVEARLAQFQANIKWRQRHEVYVTDLL